MKTIKHEYQSKHRGHLIEEEINARETHRRNVILKTNGITWINDSVAITPNTTEYTLSQIHQPVVLILGGRKRMKCDYTILKKPITQKVKAIIVIGEDQVWPVKELGNEVCLVWVFTSSMERAVAIANLIVTTGETVLLSPAAASTDWFDGYEDRGSRFIDAVFRLP